ncbi:MAG: SDR family NAD(P)-dependent oxidoreductase [Gemmatimonadota bacterium]
MTDRSDRRQRILDLPPKRLALLALQLQEELDQLRDARHEPIAVVGMGCRFPGGVRSPSDYWALLDEGRDVIVEVPAERWSVDDLYDPDPDTAGAVSTRWGGFLDDVETFDADFFSVSPREAIAMDPQQRLLLEVTWRAFEDAAIPPDRYHGEAAGVFVGICNNDYVLRLGSLGMHAIDPYYASGGAYSVAAGRLSYTFGFQGPAVSIDTACSSSLVALHQAIRSLRSGESSLALAGGVNVMCSPETQVALSRSRMMAADGRCKTFDERADGFVRAEGCGMLVLKRLSDALRDGDRIRALLRGSAIGQDGRSSGLTVPNGPAQEQVIRDALSDADMPAGDVDYVEAHGTGTSLGDPIEIRALGRVFTPGRERPLLVGSVKTNMGHLESAAGIAGVMKTVLALEHGVIPRHLHFETPSTQIDWDEHAVDVPTVNTPWPEGDGAPTAGVSSFGFSGTNAHVLLSAAPPSSGEPADLSGESSEILVASASSPDALETIWDTFHDEFDPPSERWRAFCRTSRVGRSALGWRRAVVLDDAADLGRSTQAEGPAVFSSPDRVTDPPDVAWVFTGQGAQHPGMGRELYDRYAPFRAAIDRCAEVLAPALPMPLTELLFEGDGEAASIYTTEWAQPATVAYEWALAELWRARGMRPAAVVGHSLGEFVAATIAGVMTVEEMLELVRIRGALLDSLPGGARMAALFAPAERVQGLLDERGGDISIGAFNGPVSTVVSGAMADVDGLLAHAAEHGIDHRVLKLDKAFHTRHVAPILPDLRAAARAVQHAEPTLPIAWNVTGTLGQMAPTGADYWTAHAESPVRFMQCVEALPAGIRHVLEVGPHPTLSPLVAQILESRDPVLIASQSRDEAQGRSLAEATARLWVAGVAVDWDASGAGDRSRVPIPGHPLEGERYWVSTADRAHAAAPAGALPGTRLSTSSTIYETLLTPEAPAFLSEHRYQGEVVVPGPVFVALASAATVGEERSSAAVTDFRLATPAFVPESGRRVQTHLERVAGDTVFRIESALPATDRAVWTEHATGRLTESAAEWDALVLPTEGWEPVDRTAHLAHLTTLGFDLGDDVACYDSVEGSGSFRTARIHSTHPSSWWRAALQLDAGLQVLGLTLADEDGDGRMLAAIGTMTGLDVVAEAVGCRAELASVDPHGAAVGHVDFVGEDGGVIAALRDVELRPVPRDHDASLHHRLDWVPVDVVGAEVSALAEHDLPALETAFVDGWTDIRTTAGLDRFTAALPALRTSVAGHIRAALGDALPDDAEVSTEDIRTSAGIIEAYGPLLGRFLDILVEEGVVDRSAHDTFRSRGEGASPEASATGVSAVDELVRRCGEKLRDILSGAVDPIEVLFPEGDDESTRRIYAETPFGIAFNRVIASIVASLAESAATHESPPLRILEVGAGSGSTSEAVLAALGSTVVSYCITDVSPSLVDSTRRRLDGDDRLEFGVLDIERDPGPQGIAPASYDLVIAANVVHATKDVAETLAHLRGCLAPGGVLVLLEGTGPEAWVDATFGLTEGWWRFTDRDERPDYPLLDRTRWLDLLDHSGYQDAHAVPRADDDGQVVLVARRSDTPTEELAPLLWDGRTASAESLLATLQGHATAADAAPIWIVTENAQFVAETDQPTPSASTLWGLGRTFALEHPERWGGLIDLPSGLDPEAYGTLTSDVLQSFGAEDQLAWREGTWHAPRLRPADTPDASAPTLEPGAYVITGGLGGLGLKVARWLAEHGATHVVLWGRSDPRSGWTEDDDRRADYEDLVTRTEVTVQSVDVTDATAVAQALESVRASGVPVRGVVHGAGVFDASTISALSHDEFARVLAPKAVGAETLIAATQEDELDFLVFFSSTTALLGVGSLGAYAAANQYLDGLAHVARGRGVPALSVNWGLWDVMRLASEEERERYTQTGLRPMATRDALAAMGRLIESGATSGIVVDAEWPRLKEVYELRRARPLLADIGLDHETGPSDDGNAGAASASALADLTPAERTERLLQIVEGEVRDVLRYPEERAVSHDRGFFEMGMDSLMSIELKSRLERAVGLRLPGTLTFNYPSVEAVAGFIDQEIGGASTAGEGVAPASVDAPIAPPPAVDPSERDAMTEDELAAELEARLKGLGG